MSSTWIKSVKAFKTNDERKNEKFVFFLETAESNVTSDNGGHVYHEWLFTSGDYFDVMRDVLKIAFDFEGGMAKWKPANKTPEGFIRTCRKALKNAFEVETLSLPVRFAYCDGDNKELKEIFEILAKYPSVKITYDYLGVHLESLEILAICKIRNFLDGLKRNYGKKAKLLEAKEYVFNVFRNDSIYKLFYP